MTHEEIIGRGGTSMSWEVGLEQDDYCWIWREVAAFGVAPNPERGPRMSVLQVKAHAPVVPCDLGSVLEIELGRDLHHWPILSLAVK